MLMVLCVVQLSAMVQVNPNPTGHADGIVCSAVDSYVLLSFLCLLLLCYSVCYRCGHSDFIFVIIVFLLQCLLL